MQEQGDFFTAESPEGTFVLEWHRPHPGRDLWRIYGVGVSLLLVGVLVLGVVFAWGYRLEPILRLFLGGVGGLGVVCGPLYTVLGFQSLFQEDVCLVLRSDGLIYMHNQETTFVSWDAMVRVVGEDAPPLFCVEREEEAALRIAGSFLGILPSVLAKRVWDVRRRALMGLLRPPRKTEGTYLLRSKGDQV